MPVAKPLRFRVSVGAPYLGRAVVRCTVWPAAKVAETKAPPVCALRQAGKQNLFFVDVSRDRLGRLRRALVEFKKVVYQSNFTKRQNEMSFVNSFGARCKAC
jgi:hypothetical protein